MEIARNILKNAATFFVVGVVLAFAAPYIATAVGLEKLAVQAIAANHYPLWTGAFFGTFGAISAAVTPVMDTLFAKRDEGVGSSRHASSETELPSIAPAIFFSKTHHTHATSNTPPPVSTSTTFRDKVAASKQAQAKEVGR